MKKITLLMAFLMVVGISIVSAQVRVVSPRPCCAVVLARRVLPVVVVRPVVPVVMARPILVARPLAIVRPIAVVKRRVFFY